MMSMEQDHYGVLELEPGSPMEDVKSQYRRLAKLCHPDLHGDDARSAEQFRRVNAAYTFLSDAPRKAAYDAVLQAARRAGAPPLRPAPPKSPSSPAATGPQTPVTPGGPAEGPGDSIRMTRSAWLGATAGAVVVLLVIGLSLDGSGPRQPASIGVPSSVPAGGASGAALEDGRGEGSGLGTNPDPATASDPADSDPPASDPPASDPVASAAVSPIGPAADAPPRLRVPADIAPFTAPTRPGIVGGTWAAPRTVPTDPDGAVSSDADPADALRRRLLARSHAALPRADRLLVRGGTLRAAGPDMEDGSRRILRERLAADLAGLRAARARLRPALARLSRGETPEQVRQEAGPLLTGLDGLEDAGQPVRADIKALRSAADPRPPRVAFHFGPMRPEAAAPRPDAAPAMASAAPSPPKPSDTPAPGPPVKPKTPPAPGQEFIMWGK